MTLTTAVYAKDFSGLTIGHALTIVPSDYSRHVIGGPRTATLTATGSESAVWDVIEWLRYPIEIGDAAGNVVWHGYVSEAEVAVGPYQFGVSLDDMANRVAVLYSRRTEGSSAVDPITTAWTQDDVSVATYGTKEALLTMTDASDSAALSLRNSALTIGRYPVPTVRITPDAKDVRATIRCRGWFDTLGWRYYTNLTNTNVETTAQIAAMVAASGQFLTSTSIRTASGINATQYRDGESDAKQLVEKLLKAGTSGGSRLVANVTASRGLEVSAEPTRPTNGAYSAFLDAQGQLRSEWDVPIPPHFCACGMWVRLKDVIPATIDVSRLADPSLLFIEEAAYNVASNRWQPTPRGRTNVWDLTQIGESL